MESELRVNPEKCSGCRVCQLMCSMTHQGGAFNPRWAALRVEINRNPDPGTPLSMIDMPRVCRQCEPAPCAEACPVEAFERRGEAGAWAIKPDACTGCRACGDACPFGMIAFRGESAVKCDLCGGEPACVSYCPTGALTLARGEGHV